MVVQFEEDPEANRIDHDVISYNIDESRQDVVEDIAKRSLVEKWARVAEVALNLGYSETAAFDRSFKNITG